MKESRYRSIASISNIGVWEYHVERNLLWCSNEYFEMLGYSPDEFEIKSGNLKSTWIDLLHEEDRESTSEFFRNYIESYEKFLYDTHFRMKTKSGRWAWIRSRGKLLNEEGETIVVGTHVDVTELVDSKRQMEIERHKLENIIKGTNAGTWEWNVQTNETVFNERWAEIIGHNLSDLKPTNIETWRSFVHPEDLPLAEKALEKAFQMEVPFYQIEYRMRHKEGFWVWIDDRGKVVSWTDEGKPMWMTGAHLDITDKKEREREMLYSNNLMKYIIEHNRSDVAVHDKDLNYLYVSQTYLERYRVKDKNVIGKHHYEVFPDLPQKWRDVHQRALKGEVLCAEEDPYFRADGTVDWTRWECRPWYDNEGEIGGIVVYTEIINERREMEQALIKEKELFKTTLLSVGDGVISTDEKGNIQVMNPVAENLTGWSQAEASGKPLCQVLDIINEFSRESCLNPVEEVLKTGKVIELANHTILISKDGSEIPIEDSAAPIKDFRGNINGVVIVFRDFTEKREKIDKIEYLSYHDHLTGLYNRRYMEEVIKKFNDTAYLPLSFLVIDVNGLKLTNDAFGHAMGDKLLKLVSNVLKKISNNEGIVGRMGGDEFCILMPNTDAKKADRLKNEIISMASRSKLDSLIVSVSVGYATKNKLEEKLENIMVMADNDMYKDKIKFGKTMRSRTIETVLRNINFKYDQEQIHTERVSQYCEAIAKEMNYATDKVAEIKTAGVLHDIGKIMIPPELLNKVGRLTNDEFEVIKRHPEIGYQILKSVDEYAMLAEAVLYHHERWDGKGYPEGLKGEDIPVVSRIVAVADAFEAMTAKRAYQSTRTVEEALSELVRCSGTQFDSAIVDLFVKLMSA
ncbi:PAS domain S-box protein [Alkalibacter saccharofermentans]|uniref:PAS domain S-box-containing protein/diguanylate cyclase (GGDEF) domain-containing protein n=1 Tax=Alkalibacter saccharofermentans DSM 14828 TaxID=1120975 RepID=A0A1M4Z218_9FIRM|nr:PAS domain S-box protein [Alkalibacter saccharofermentans]SHF12109.1 PAS domain S-box-containing protein/diguanylate cyclase (GGDEF) domain-containing protein [Alkalibacter saccharofermentans DSM 14828]